MKDFIKSHLVADTIEELHTAAEFLWIPRRAFNVSDLGIPHYAVSETIRKNAIREGAQELTEDGMREFVSRFKKEHRLDVSLTTNKEGQ